MASETEIEDFLAHHGVKGMHWGVHRAKADAKEFSKAKQFYGEGAGNRRKLIKAQVESRSKKSPEYAALFQKYLEEQDAGKHASQAKRERARKDVTKSVSKTARGVHRSLTGGFGSVSVTAAAIAGAYGVAHRTGADKVLIQKASALFNSRTSHEATKAWLRSQGIG